MKRILACIMSVVLVVGLLPVTSLAAPISPASTSALQSAEAERLQYTRTITLGTNATGESWSVRIPLTAAELEAGKEVRIRFKGSTPRLYLLETAQSGTWLYKKSLTASHVEAIEGEADWKLACFTQSDINAAWDIAAADQSNPGGAVEKGGFNYAFVSKDWSATTPTTFDRVSIVGGPAPVHPAQPAVSGLTAQQITQNMGLGWNLGNTFDSWNQSTNLGSDGGFGSADIDAERWWGNPFTTKEMIDVVKASGFNTVRVPVTWFQHLYDDGTNAYHIDEAWLARVREVVDYAYDQGMYVILNTHHEMWTRTPQFGDTDDVLPAMREELTAIWEQIATEFAGYDQRLVFEALNEPRASGEGISNSREWGTPTAGDVATLNALNQAFVDTVRGVDSPYAATRLLMVPTNSASTTTYAMSQLKVPITQAGVRDPYVAVSVHAYAPSSMTAESSNASFVDATFDPTDEIRLERALYGVYATFVHEGVPVVMGEFGSVDHDNEAERAKLAKRYIQIASSYGIPCLLWDGGGKTDMNYLDRTASPVTWYDNQDSVITELADAAQEGTQKWGAAQDTPVPAGTPTGLQLNDDPVELPDSSADSGMFGTNWDDLQTGNVAIEFEGTAPTLVLRDSNGTSWTEVGASYVAWNDDVSGGVAYYWPSHLAVEWEARGTDEHPRDCNDIKRLTVRTYGATTMKRLVLTGVTLPDVSNGSYGDGVTSKLMYTRPVQLVNPAPSDGSASFASVYIDMTSPDVQGKDVAVRYTGTTPYLAFGYSWEVRANDANKTVTASGLEGWTSVLPNRIVAADDGTGQKVAFFRYADIIAAWRNRASTWTDNAAIAGKNNQNTDYNQMLVCVGSGTCNLVETVVLGVDVPAAPTMRDEGDVRTGKQVIADMGAGYNFGGALECNLAGSVSKKDGGWGRNDLSVEIHWGSPYLTEKMFADIKQRGFKSVRIPTTWWQHIYNDGSYTIDRAWLARVHEVVDYALRNDLYVILNTHHENWIDRADMDTSAARVQMVEEFKAVWTQIAVEFEGYDQRLIFEGMNEPHAAGVGGDREWNAPTSGDLETVNALNTAFVELIHGMDAHKNRLLLCSTYGGHPELTHTSGYVFPDDGSGLVAVSTHPYTPYSFTFEHEAATRPYSGSYAYHLDRVMNGVLTRFVSQGIPVVFDEFGCYYYANSEDARLQWLEQYITWTKKMGIPCLAWPLDRSDESLFYDRSSGMFPDESKRYIDLWLGILDDASIGWGSGTSADEHAELDSGTAFALSEGKQHIYQNGESGSEAWRTNFWKVTAAQLDKHELAVKFTGVTPRLVLMDSNYNGWTTIEPYFVDTDAGIAYFPADGIALCWSDVEGTTGIKNDVPYTVGSLDKVCISTQGAGSADGGGTWIDAVVLLEMHEHEWGAWQVVTAPTCTEDGVRERVCQLNDAHVQREVLPATGHDWDEGAVTKEPSSTDSGIMTYTCKNDASHTRAEVIPTEYAVVFISSDEWEQGSSEGCTFSSAATIDKFVCLEVDDAEVARSSYDVMSGSTKVTLHPDFLSGLSIGEHVAKIVSTDGIATATFVVKRPATSAPTSDSGLDDTTAPTSTNVPKVTPSAGDTPATGNTPVVGDTPAATTNPTPSVSAAPKAAAAETKAATPIAETRKSTATPATTPSTGDSLTFVIPIFTTFAILAFAVILIRRKSDKSTW